MFNSMKKIKFEIPSWQDIHNSLFDITKKILDSKFKPDLIVGISRGGWIPARIVSDLLEINQIANISVEYYNQLGETKRKPIITQTITVPVSKKKILLVDDVADTGNSLAMVNKYLEKKSISEIRIATIYYKPWSKIKPDYFQKKTTLWIIFPWEIKESVKKIIIKYQNKMNTITRIKNELIKSGMDPNLIEIVMNNKSGLEKKK